MNAIGIPIAVISRPHFGREGCKFWFLPDSDATPASSAPGSLGEGSDPLTEVRHVFGLWRQLGMLGSFDGTRFSGYLEPRGFNTRSACGFTWALFAVAPLTPEGLGLQIVARALHAATAWFLGPRPRLGVATYQESDELPKEATEPRAL